VIPLSALRPLSFHEHLDDFGTGKLGRRVLFSREHLAHLRPREEDVELRVVRAGFRGAHAPALRTEESVFEEERCDPELLGLELFEDVLGVVGTVVATNAGVIPPHYEVGATVVSLGPA
jgi:hypothetical protein